MILYFLKEIEFIFLKQFLIHRKTGQKEQNFYYTPASTHVQPSPLSTSPTRVLHLLQQAHHYYQSPQFTLELTFGVVHSMGLNKCILTYIHHYIIIQISFNAQNILCLLPIYPCPSQPLIFFMPPQFCLFQVGKVVVLL